MPPTEDRGPVTEPATLPADAGPVWSLPTATYPALDEDLEADVVVVGGGIAGLTTAAVLVERGVDVVVLEARLVGSGTSGHTTAKASALQGARYRQIADAHGSTAAAAYARSQLDGLAWLAERARQVPGARWEQRTAASYATTDDGRRTIEAETCAALAAGLAVEAGQPDVPFPTTGAVLLAEQGQLDPGPYLAALAADIDRASSGRVFEQTRATSVRGTRRIHVRTDHGSVRARHAVIATLLPITDRGLFFARASPASPYLIAVEVDGPLPRDMCLSVDEPVRSLRTAHHDGRDVLLVGGGGHDTGRGAPTRAHQQELADWAAAAFPGAVPIARWTAHDYVPADHLPWVGSASLLSPDVLVATGFEKWGMTMGTAAALALADRITGTDSGSAAWAGTFDPRRTTPRGLAAAARLNAKVAGRLTADWIRPDAPAAPDGTGRRRRAGLVPVGEADPADGRVDVVCTHLGGICSWNDADRTWDCPLHGSRFSADGTVVTAPATRPLRTRRTPDGPTPPG